MTDKTMRYTDQERDTLRNSAMGAMMLVSKSDPGIMGTIKEMIAGSKALRGASPEMQEIFKGSGGMPKMPKGSQGDMESNIMSGLQQSMQILSKSPQDQQNFRNTIMNACDQVAKAQGGVSDNEMMTINKIKSALGG
ncbi:hypothetical protein Ais01nite_52310 [Asanoa ishikariensis]|uniref:Uncharacterized protein n=1 Tax=Asanoa ishikariensis TaxID=137265 RepID=A0A1H3RHZ1_9ACTN|nr:hypothetical protein [Asanoa ishikariensis]GIF67196.1 hypothetical protein Ais01nite_52310 [Asanoa ishikariensis]SDZ25266.1 hypothetical protein SAMN05421684_3845 [Asanoa ishikariensis]